MFLVLQQNGEKTKMVRWKWNDPVVKRFLCMHITKFAEWQNKKQETRITGKKSCKQNILSYSNINITALNPLPKLKSPPINT